MARLLKAAIALLLVFLFVNCSKAVDNQTKDGAEVVPQMLFKTAAGGSTIEPPMSVRQKAQYVEFNINAGNGEKIFRRVAWGNGSTKFESVPEGSVNMEIRILDGANVVLMQGSTSFGLSRNQFVTVMDVPMSPVIPMFDELKVRLSQICASAMRITIEKPGILNAFSVYLFDGFDVPIDTIVFVTTEALKDPDGYPFIIDSTTAFPAIGSEIKVKIHGRYNENMYSVPTQLSDFYRLSWTGLSPCTGLNVDVPTIINGRVMCQTKVFFEWPSTDREIDYFILRREKRDLPLGVWTNDGDTEMRLWRDYNFISNKFNMVAQFNYSTLLAYRYSIAAVKAGKRSLFSNPFEFTVGGTAICP